MNFIDYKAIGQRIRKQRELSGYTREQLAEKLEVSAKFCSDIELGIKGFSLTTLMKISELLCLSTDYILFGNKKITRRKLKCCQHLFRNAPKIQETNCLQ